MFDCSGRARPVPVEKTPAKTAHEPLSYDEAQKMVQFEVDGRILRVNINDEIDVCSKEDFPDDNLSENKPEAPPGRCKMKLCK